MQGRGIGFNRKERKKRNEGKERVECVERESVGRRKC
jgi:hypothetical protein